MMKMKTSKENDYEYGDDNNQNDEEEENFKIMKMTRQRNVNDIKN